MKSLAADAVRYWRDQYWGIGMGDDPRREIFLFPEQRVQRLFSRRFAANEEESERRSESLSSSIVILGVDVCSSSCAEREPGPADRGLLARVIWEAAGGPVLQMSRWLITFLFLRNRQNGNEDDRAEAATKCSRETRG